MAAKLTPGQRLTQLREFLGLTFEKFSAPLEVHHQTVRRWETGDVDIAPKNARKIAATYGVTLEWLMDGKGEMTARKPDEIDLKSLTAVPILSARPCAGQGNSLDDYVGAIGFMPFDTQWLRRTFNVPPENLRLLEVDGDSMMPNIQPDELVFVDASPFQDFQRLGVWVLSIDGSLYVKRILRLKSNEYQATSDNPVYPPIPLDENTRLMGRVVGGHKRFF
jgi:phage repressor protein C with HTH and peptisase S24 domain